ncbi:MAG: Asp-tRNA(Asn)/Glu-tRNA(Gln) amidotransferase subunit GatC [Gammaproteobacteria bacterium]|nr:Asp-tRNA(Asn)/Glu-tRNA(Gln) amidotransferase subunit GatC [Gammaproteobacteria bacterium]
MPLDENQVNNIAQLAHIEINPEDISHYTRDISNILDMVKQLEQASTTDIEPLSNPLEQIQRLRADVVTESNQRDKLQENAPLTEKGLFLVPKVIE